MIRYELIVGEITEHETGNRYPLIWCEILAENYTYAKFLAEDMGFRTYKLRPTLRDYLYVPEIMN